MVNEPILHYAVRHNQKQIVQYLLTYFPNFIRQRNAIGQTILCATHDPEMMKILLHYCDHELWNESMRNMSPNINALQHAIREGWVAIVQLFMDRDPDLMYDVFATRYKVLLPIITYILSKKPSLTKQVDSMGQNKMHRIVDSFHLDDMQLLPVLHATDTEMVHVKDAYGFTPFLLAVTNKRKGLVDAFLSLCPSVIHHTDLQQRNVLFYSTCATQIKQLLKLKPTLIGEVSICDDTPLHHVVKKDDIAIVRAIFKAKPKLMFIKNKSGETPLQVASQSILQYLLNRYPNLLETDSCGNTILHKAIQSCDNTTIAIVFTNQLSSVNARNKNNETPFHLAVKSNNVYLIRLFQRHITIETVAETWRKVRMLCAIDLRKSTQSTLRHTKLLPDLVSIIERFLGV